MFKDLKEIAQYAKVFQEQAKKIQDELGRKKVEASSGGGMVTVVANGRQEILTITLDPEVVRRQDIGMLQDLILSAANSALKASRDLAAQEMKGIAGGLLPPGLTNLF